MKPTHYSLCLLLITCLLGASSLGQAVPQEKRTVLPVPAVSNVHTTDDVDVLRETQLQVSTKDHTGLIWWIPFEFWAQSAEKNGNSPEKAREQLKTLRDYTIVGILVGKFSSLGSVDYVPPSDLQKKTSIRDSEGQDYPALTELTGDAKSLADMLKQFSPTPWAAPEKTSPCCSFPQQKKEANASRAKPPKEVSLWC